jgi:hypothetical protein
MLHLKTHQSMERIKIYLAGGMNSNWQTKLINSVGNEFYYFNPQNHLLEIGVEYTNWDLFYVQKADIVFAFMEAKNPSGIGLSLEVGFAKALNKTISLVDEKSSTDNVFKGKFHIVRNSASVVFDDFESGINYLKSFLRISKSNDDVLF